MSKSATEVLQEFSLGLDTLTAPNRLDAKYSPDCTNFWNDDGALAKRPGQLRTSTTNEILGRAWSGVSLHTSVYATVENLLILAGLGISRNILLYTSNATGINRMQTGGAGTATTTIASAVVTGTGSNWLTTAAVGAIFSQGNTVGQILTVDSDTQLTLTAAFGANNTTASYLISNSWGTSKRVSFADMNSKTWICGIGSTAVSFDGTTQTFVTAFPQAAYSLSYKNYVFAANTTANPSRISWCTLKDPTTWPASNFIDVNPDDGFPIVGLVYDGQSIVIIKTNSVWKLAGDIFDPANPSYTLTQIYTPSDFMINSGKSFQLTPNGYIMLGRRGFYLYNGAGAITKVLELDRIRGEVANISFAGIGLMPSPNTEPASIMVDGNYWLQVSNSLSTISAADKELTYVIDKTGAVWKWTQTAAGMISDFAYLNGVLYGVNSWSGGTPGLIKLNTGSSDAHSTTVASTPINASVSTKVVEFGHSQRFGKAYLYFKKQTAISPAGTATTTDTSETASYVVTLNTNDYIDFHEGGGDLAAQLTAGTYIMGSSSAVAGSYCALVKTKMDAAGSGGYTVTFNASTLKLTVTKASGSFMIRWFSGGNFAKNAHATMGFTLADTAFASSATSDSTTAAPVIGAATVSGSSTANFLSCMVPGSIFTCNGTSGTVLSVASNTSMTLTAPFGAINTNQAYTVSGGTNLTFEYSIDEGTFVSNTIDMSAGTGTRVKSAPIIIGQVGRSIQFRVSNNVTAQALSVYTIEFERQELKS